MNVRDAVAAFDATSAIVTRVVSAAFLASKVTSTASAFRLYIDPDSHQSRFVGVDQVRQSADFHDVGAGSLASLVLP